MTDQTRLRHLNEEYIRSSLQSDMDWYRAHLASDFVCISHDAQVFDKHQFIEMIGKGSDQKTYHLDLVDVRIFGDVALIRAIGAWESKAGQRGVTHYTDVWVRDTGNAEWRCVSAQLTRPPN